VLKTQIVPRGGIFFGGSLPFAEVGAARYLRGAEAQFEEQQAAQTDFFGSARTCEAWDSRQFFVPLV